MLTCFRKVKYRQGYPARNLYQIYKVLGYKKFIALSDLMVSNSKYRYDNPRSFLKRAEKKWLFSSDIIVIIINNLFNVKLP